MRADVKSKAAFARMRRSGWAEVDEAFEAVHFLHDHVDMGAEREAAFFLPPNQSSAVGVELIEM
jgi:hypothetical protein